jgi:hypothetical protein
VDTLSFQDALAELVSNAVQALDAVYFDAGRRRLLPASVVRDHDAAVAHRWCLRVASDRGAGTVSLTDLGVGMTRADLINALGVGGGGAASQGFRDERGGGGGGEEGGSGYTTETTLEDDDEDDDDSQEEQDEGVEEDNESVEGSSSAEGEEGEETHVEDENSVEEGVVDRKPSKKEGARTVSCRTKDVGGFYAALCALGTGVRVGTKSKFDDYYEFELGQMSESVAVEATAFEEFCIVRPREEGTELSVQTGFDRFQDVRGDSGTCVTLHLNQAAKEAGLLDEQAVLKPMLLKIVETTQYTVAFSTDTDGAQAIIDASAQEQQFMAELKREDQQMSMEPIINTSSVEKEDATAGSHNSVVERAKYIPLRLTLGERKMLRLVEAAMTCCDYTTEVDRPNIRAARRTHEQLRRVTSVLRGLVTACDYEAGQKLLSGESSFADYESFFTQMFEIARRHKIMNPEKMRTEYGKLVYLLQDAVSPAIQQHLGFSVMSPIKSVYKFLEERRGLDMLSDKLIEVATEEILAGKKSRSKIDQQIRQKEKAVNVLKRKYRTSRLSSEDIHMCLYSICDNNSFLNSNRVPIDKVIDFLKDHFSPDSIEDGYSLSIISGEEGARLSHDHERQYYFALQSLTLWRDIIDDMFRLWAMAEEDLLSEAVPYSLQDTGQGMQRVQQSPRTYKAMQQILSRGQKKVSHWVGSSVIHMGDHNVPNALSFIDKYTQGTFCT